MTAPAETQAQPVASRVTSAGEWSGTAEQCTLDYDERFLRRKVLAMDTGETFLVDFAHATSLNAGDAFVLDDERLVEVVAATEPLLEIRGDELHRLAWHIGNRHTPCQIGEGRLLIKRDHVLADMLIRLGASLENVVEPFTPEGGAYGHGRTHGHAH